MKTATMPALRVQPELRQAAEEMLQPGETLSGFVEESLRRNVERRQAQQAFLARGLASRDAAKKSGKYVSADAVLAKLAAKIEHAGAVKVSKTSKAKSARPPARRPRGK
ncbi:MAG: YlcI/YnfO family protein [Betaproteobacteria bacterium]